MFTTKREQILVNLIHLSCLKDIPPIRLINELGQKTYYYQFLKLTAAIQNVTY